MKAILLAIGIFVVPVHALTNTNVTELAFSAETIKVSKKEDDTSKKVEKEVKDAVDVDKEVSPIEVVDAAAELIGEAKQYFDDGKKAAGSQTASIIVWTGVAAALLKLLLALLKITSPFWKQTRGKLVLRLICVLVGVVFGVVSYMGLGYTWYDSAITVLGGPGAILITELQKMFPFLRRSDE